jgi:pyridoxamine 5'-phosphate oxidase
LNSSNSPVPEDVAHLSRELRTDYDSDPFTEDQASHDPFAQFLVWFEQASKQEASEANAMAVSTVNRDGRPSSRIVLLKELDEYGFVFYTNLNSRKGQEIANCSAASLLFYWPALHRQVRIEGSLEQVAPEISDAYFASRPKSAQIGAWASQQSQPIKSRQEFENILQATAARFADSTSIPRPPHWGGYRCRPTAFEFWQGQPSRLHDRLHYTLTESSEWLRTRLMP